MQVFVRAVRRLGCAALITVSVAPSHAVPQEADRQYAFMSLKAIDLHVAQIAFRLQRAAVGICPKRSRDAGLLLQDLRQYGRSDWASARQAFGFAGEIGVAAVISEGPAARAGIRGGDDLVAIDGVATDALVPATRANQPTFDRMAAIESVLAHGMASGRTRLTLARNGATVLAEVAGEEVCASRVQVRPSARANASADGTYVQVTTAMVAAARSDDELAAVIAHELAHNILRHRTQDDPIGRSGNVRVTRSTRQMEEAADRLSAWLLVAAGFDPQGALALWRHFGALASGIFSDGSHPSRSRRRALIAGEVPAARAALARGGPLTVGKLPADLHPPGSSSEAASNSDDGAGQQP